MSIDVWFDVFLLISIKEQSGGKHIGVVDVPIGDLCTLFAITWSPGQEVKSLKQRTNRRDSNPSLPIKTITVGSILKIPLKDHIKRKKISII